MKILLLTQVLPYPPDSGPKVKTWNVIKYLAQHHEVTLVSFVRGDQSEDVRELEKLCRAVYTVPIERSSRLDAVYMTKSFFTRQPFLMLRDDRREMRDLLDRLSAETQFDVVHADQLNMAQYAIRVNGKRLVLDAHNALWLLYKRLWGTMSSSPKKWLLGRDWKLLKDYEGEMIQRFDATVAVSEEDKSALEQAAGKSSNIVVIPISVDTDEVRPVQRAPDASRILHIGTMYWPPNVDGVLWFIRDVLPLIRERRPGVLFDVVGARPPDELQALAGRGSGINVTGYVEDPTLCIKQAGVLVVPLRAGGGMRVKILNALSQELPIVTTTIGCEGIPVKDGVHLLVADSPEDFARATIRLLEDQDLARDLARQGRLFVQDRFDYRTACRLLENVYQPADSLT
jgi:polysaccharide biosynthesis protein PslH